MVKLKYYRFLQQQQKNYESYNLNKLTITKPFFNLTGKFIIKNLY